MVKRKSVSVKNYLARLHKIPTASLSDAVDKVGLRGYMSHQIKPLNTRMKIAGTAITVRHVRTSETKPPLKALEAIDLAGPGNVVVYGSDNGEPDISFLGGLMSTAAKKRGIEGIVCDGGVRDLAEILELGLNVFSRSIVPATSLGRTEVVDLKRKITCGDITVSLGDYIVGDGDGVVVIPKGKIEKVLELAEQIDKTEKAEAEELKKGRGLVETVRKYARL